MTLLAKFLYPMPRQESSVVLLDMSACRDDDEEEGQMIRRGLMDAGERLRRGWVSGM